MCINILESGLFFPLKSKPTLTLVEPLPSPVDLTVSKPAHQGNCSSLVLKAAAWCRGRSPRAALRDTRMRLFLSSRASRAEGRGPGPGYVGPSCTLSAEGSTRSSTLGAGGVVGCARARPQTYLLQMCSRAKPSITAQNSASVPSSVKWG